MREEKKGREIVKDTKRDTKRHTMHADKRKGESGERDTCRREKEREGTLEKKRERKKRKEGIC